MLMVGAGGIYFRRSDDLNKLHFLGNCTQFNITTDVTTVEKYSSMNKKRELMAAVTTQTKASGSIVLNEYNMYNLALGLYGTEGVHVQTGTTLASEVYEVPSVPGIIELKDADGNRYVNITDIAVAPMSAVLPEAKFNQSSSSTYTISSDRHKLTFTSEGGQVSLNGTGYTGSTNATFVYRITAPTSPTPGDLDGYTFEVASNMLNLNIGAGVTMTGDATTGMSLTVPCNGVSVTFSVTAGDTFPSTGVMTFHVEAGVNTFKEGKDYVIESESIRGGLIKIKKDGAIKEGDSVRISGTVPAGTYVTVSGSAAGKITGELLFLGDPNQGNALMIEAWKCNIRPKHNWAYAL